MSDINIAKAFDPDTNSLRTTGGGGGGGGGGDASAANQVTGNASLASIKTNTDKLIAPSVNSGATDATTQRVIAATDSPEVAVLGATGDAAVVTNTTGSVSGKLRGLVKLLIDLIAKTPALGTAGSASADVITVQGIASGTAQAVSGTVTANAGTGTLAVSAAALPLPTGAATSAKQPALGTAGAAATDVITVQGIASGTAQPITPPAYTAPVCGEIGVTTSAVVLPTITCKLVQIKAAAANAGKTYLGVGSGLTATLDGTTDTTTGLELSAGESSGWLPVDNLNRFYIRGSATGSVTYIAMN